MLPHHAAKAAIGQFWGGIGNETINALLKWKCSWSDIFYSEQLQGTRTARLVMSNSITGDIALISVTVGFVCSSLFTFNKVFGCTMHQPMNA